MNKSKKVWRFVVVLMMVASGFAAMASADITSESDVKASSATIYVPDNYTMIQWAVDNATDGDIIIVNSGTYYENVNVNKQLILRGVDTGTGKPVVDAGGGGSAITLSADGITLDGFTVTNSGSSWRDAGIKVYSNNNIITGNNASNNNWYGIYLYDTSHNTIIDNTVRYNDDHGIYLDGSHGNTITGNTFVNDGLFVYAYSLANTVEDNIVNGKPLVYLEATSDIVVTDAGQVILVNCNNITVDNLDLSNTSIGIELWETEDSVIANNDVRNNDGGILLYYSSNNSISGNDVRNNDGGIRLCSSSNNTISGNTVSCIVPKPLTLYTHLLPHGTTK